MELKKPKIRFIIAAIVAVFADILQWLLVPFFSELGALNPINDIIDIAVGGIMIWLLGFHWVFVPAALGELLPVANLMPFWTGAVFVAALGKDGMLPNQAAQPGQNALPLSAAGQGPAALPGVMSPAQVSGNVNSAESAHH